MAIFDLGSGSARGNVTATIDGTTYWAERGLVHFVVDGKIAETLGPDEPRRGTLPVRDALVRLRVINLYCSSAVESPFQDKQQLQARRKFVEDMIQVCKLAREQGEPWNPDAIKEAQRRKKRVMVLDPATKSVNPDGTFNPFAAPVKTGRFKI